MRSKIWFLVSILVLCLFPNTALAATEPVITQQPHSATYNEYANAEYSVSVQGDNLLCNWYLHFNGEDYGISDTSGGMRPWEYYAGETYGPRSAVNGNTTTFTYSFGGIGKELDGCYIYAVIEDGHFEITSDKAYITVIEGAATPPVINVPATMSVFQDETLDLYCAATAPDGSALEYLWYETSTGNLMDIIAVNRGSEMYDTLRCDTSEVGTRYYVCVVTTANGGSAYSSVIPVTVMEAGPAVEPPVILTDKLADGIVGEAYSAKLESSDTAAEFGLYDNPGGVNNFDESGLTLSASGVISGTPKAPGTYTFTVCAVGEGGEGYMTYTMTVNEPQAAPEAPNDSDEGESPMDGESQPDTPESGAEQDQAQSGNEEPEKPADNGASIGTIAIVAVAAAVLGGVVTGVILKKKKS